ncbi:hypothetical protein HEO41_023720, partial [Escherichia coli]|nr:hypothetical protein [Escherichia coli]MBB8400152.1 hypothetical protein [Escherichia coli]
MSLIIDVISRKTSVKQTLINPGDVTVVIYEPSVVQVHAQAGNDSNLLIVFYVQIMPDD